MPSKEKMTRKMKKNRANHAACFQTLFVKDLSKEMRSFCHVFIDYCRFVLSNENANLIKKIQKSK